MRCLIIASLAVGLIVPSLARAGSAGNPASNVGKENIGFTFEIENQVKNVDKDQATSKRWLGKVIWGATDKLDIYAKLGASDLKVAVPDERDFKGKRGMTWGGGARYMVAEIAKPKIATYLDVQMLSFSTGGVVRKELGEYPDKYTVKYSDRYKWNEVQFSFFGVWKHDVFAPYIGFGITNVFGNVTKDVSSVLGDQHDAHDFREDAIPELIVGVDIGLGGTGHLSGEIRYSEEEDVSFFIGASELWRLR
jgi:hypothetical protein